MCVKQGREDPERPFTLMGLGLGLGLELGLGLDGDDFRGLIGGLIVN